AERAHAAVPGEDTVWRSALNRYKDTLIRSIQGPRFAVPAELLAASDNSDGMAVFKRLLHHFAHLTKLWPALWRAAPEAAALVRGATLSCASARPDAAGKESPCIH
ncbi:MAG: hypothetical protein ACREK1_14000, partial [Longimicrobiales bacterium]